MYKRIILNGQFSTKEKIKRLLSLFGKFRGARILWNRRYKKVFRLYPELSKKVISDIEKKHRSYWKPFKNNVNLATLRVCCNISEVLDYKYIPEEIFMVDIEPTLNRESSVRFLSFKSMYNKWFDKNIFPKDFFHNIDGQYYDSNLQLVTVEDVRCISRNIDFPVVFKPNKDSYGGKGVCFPKNENELMNIIQNRSDFIIQEKIRQHAFFTKFNPQGLNTVRVNVYRSVKDNRFHVINVALRMGVGGSLDNLSSGGIASMVGKDGCLNGFAVDYYGKKYLVHPDTGENFNQKIPDYESMKNLALSIANKVFYARLLCLDLCYDEDGRWRLIEVNDINGATIRFAQYHGALFFDEFSDEVYHYCVKNHWSLN